MSALDSFRSGRALAPRRRAQDAFVGVAGVLAMALICGIYFLKAPALLIGSLVAGLAVAAFSLLVRQSIESFSLLVLLNYAYWIISGIFVGTFDLRHLADPVFYDRDGRIFICYIPLLCFAIISATKKDCESVVLLIKVLTLISIPLYLAWLTIGTTTLSGSRERHFFGFLTSHTGAGTFFGFLAVFLLLYGAERRSRWILVLGLCALPTVDGSASRATAVSLLVVGVWYLLVKRNWRAFAYCGVVLTILLLLLATFDANLFVRMAKLFQPELWQEVSRIAADSNWEPGEERKAAGEDFNVISRVLFFLYAVRMFMTSPLLGFGFGRYGDHSMQFVGEPGWLQFAAVGQVTEVWHAHNSYLHLLAESGLLGLGLMLLLWAVLHRRLSRSAAAAVGSFRAYLVACQGLVVYSFAAALFGHSLASPSLVVPVSTCIGVGLAAARRSDARRRRGDGLQSAGVIGPMRAPAMHVSGRRN